MVDAGFFELLVRSVVSLGVVLAIIAVAYVVVKRRANGGVGIGRPSMRTINRSAPNRPATTPAGRSATKKTPVTLETIGRIGLSRGSAAIAVRFADQVVLLGVTEGSPISVLQEMPAARWDEIAETEDLVSTPLPIETIGQAVTPAARPGFVDALREATARRA